MENVYAIFGVPITHSLSPILHKQFARQFDLALEYKIYNVPRDQYFATLRKFFANGGIGANITSPYKKLTYEYLSTTCDEAKASGAVNTLSSKADGSLFGANTDGIGFLRDLQRKQIDISAKNVVILGTGGAAKAIANVIKKLKPSTLHLVGRDGYHKLATRKYDVVINATSAGLQGVLPPIPRAMCLRGSTCYDLNYGKAADPFIKYALTKGAKRTINGMGMLIEQAAESFYLWHQLRPNTDHISELYVL